jgi:hypothetical protein
VPEPTAYNGNMTGNFLLLENALRDRINEVDRSLREEIARSHRELSKKIDDTFADRDAACEHRMRPLLDWKRAEEDADRVQQGREEVHTEQRAWMGKTLKYAWDNRALVLAVVVAVLVAVGVVQADTSFKLP